jgi:hypothetical protein
MSQLKTHPWWPTAWLPYGGRCATGEVRTNGVLKNVRRSTDNLTLVVDCNGVICTATVSDPYLAEDTLILLRHVLLQRYGEPMAVIEDFDIELGGMFPVVK